MQITHKDLKQGIMKVKIESLDDLWDLSNIIEENDLITARTERKIKLGGSEDRKSQVVIKHITITLVVEKIEFSQTNNTLRISGKITESPEDIPRGSYHTITAEESTVLTIKKEQWLKYQLDKLKQASQQKQLRVIICVFDREHAIFAVLKRYGYEILSEIKGDTEKKNYTEKISTNFYNEIVKILQTYDEKYKATGIICGSPAFWKNYLYEKLKDTSLKSKILLAPCNSVSKNGIDELLKRPEIQTAIKDDKTINEMKLIDQLFLEIKKGEKASYGTKDTIKAVDYGAAEILLLTDNYLMKGKENNTAKATEKLMRTAEANGAEIKIVSSEHDGGKKLDGLGGIAALLRYKI
ncbi:mRNA surveillance protein pelota [Candidatus Woesearchaeota archaeon]|nr:mRNA surveillance protein pelota [Candidatus Woesearchaeota archaeon]